MIFGSRASGTLAIDLQANTGYISKFHLSEVGRIVKLTAPLDGLGAGRGTHPVRAVIYDARGALLASSAPVEVEDGAGVSWFDFSLQTNGSAGVLLEPGDYLLGLLSGGDTTARAWVTPGPTNRIENPSMEYDLESATPSWFTLAVRGGMTRANVLLFKVRGTWARSGAHSILFSTATDSVPSGGAFGAATPRMDVSDVQGEPFSARASINVTRGAQITLRISAEFYDGDGNALDAYESTPDEPLSAPAVRDVYVTFAEVPDDAATAVVTYWIQSDAGASQQVIANLDGFMAGILDPRAYFDGDLAIYVWAGVPGASASSVGKAYADTYADGPLQSIAAVDGDGLARVAIYATYIREFVPPANVDDEYLSALPFYSAQRALGATPPIVGSDMQVDCGWHGTLTDPHRGSVAIVRTNGVLSALVGERVRITYEERSVVAYVDNELDVLDDISLPRRSFMQLAVPSMESIAVTVETLGADG